MERLLTLPLPTIYGVHLKQTVTLYLVVLPLVLVEGGRILATPMAHANFLMH
jgi:predicted membrane chloride channel (bestrophin family)